MIEHNWIQENRFHMINKIEAFDIVKCANCKVMARRSHSNHGKITMGKQSNKDPKFCWKEAVHAVAMQVQMA